MCEVDTEGTWFSCLAIQGRLGVALGDEELGAWCGLPVSQEARLAAFRAAFPTSPHTRPVSLC